MDTITEIVTAINAYADAQRAAGSTRNWLALTHRGSKGAEADAARAIRDAGKDALDMIQDWPEIEKRENGSVVLQAPDGMQVLYAYDHVAYGIGETSGVERVSLL